MMHFKMGQMQNYVEEMKTKMHELETLNMEKDTFYDNLPIRFIDMCEDMEFTNSPESDVASKAIEEANILFKQPFAFYGGYAQLSANAKD